MSLAYVILLGLGTVFVGLICLIFLIKLLSLIVAKAQKKETAAAPVKAAANTPEPNRQELVAACSAAIASVMGVGVQGLRILAIKKLD